MCSGFAIVFAEDVQDQLPCLASANVVSEVTQAAQACDKQQSGMLALSLRRALDAQSTQFSYESRGWPLTAKEARLNSAA